MIDADAIAAVLVTLTFIAIVAIRYILTSGLFAWIGERLRPGIHHGLKPQIRREIRWSLLSAIVYGAPAGIVRWGWRELVWTQIYIDSSAHPLWWIPASFFLCLFIHDTWFFWTHRAMHQPWLFAKIHAVHHASRPPTAWAAMSFHPWEAVSGAIVIPFLVFVMPLHFGVVLAVLAVMTIMGVTNHMGWELFPSRLVHGKIGTWLITASHHQKHHDRYNCNYGLYFRFWDRICGTDHGLGSFGLAASRG